MEEVLELSYQAPKRDINLEAMDTAQLRKMGYTVYESMPMQCPVCKWHDLYCPKECSKCNTKRPVTRHISNPKRLYNSIRTTS